jgi:hypothetical protein
MKKNGRTKEDEEAKAASHFDEKKGHSIGGRSYDNKK